MSSHELRQWAVRLLPKREGLALCPPSTGGLNMNPPFQKMACCIPLTKLVPKRSIQPLSLFFHFSSLDWAARGPGLKKRASSSGQGCKLNSRKSIDSEKYRLDPDKKV
jgi:hypothetical protein